MGEDVREWEPYTINDDSNPKDIMFKLEKTSSGVMGGVHELCEDVAEKIYRGEDVNVIMRVAREINRHDYYVINEGYKENEPTHKIIKNYYDYIDGDTGTTNIIYYDILKMYLAFVKKFHPHRVLGKDYYITDCEKYFQGRDRPNTFPPAVNTFIKKYCKIYDRGITVDSTGENRFYPGELRYDIVFTKLIDLSYLLALLFDSYYCDGFHYELFCKKDIEKIYEYIRRDNRAWNIV